MSKIADHYTSGKLLERLNAALKEDGADPAHPTIETLAPYDQFHGRGMEATEEIAGMLKVAADRPPARCGQRHRRAGPLHGAPVWMQGHRHRPHRGIL